MPFILAVDFDGTLFDGDYPEKGNPKVDIINKIKEFKKHGAEIALWTCREEDVLQEAVERSKEQGLEWDAVNDNTPSQKKFMAKVLKENGEVFATRKIFADFYLDDKAMNLDIFLKINVKETCDAFRNRHS